LKNEKEILQTKISELEKTVAKLQQSVATETWYDNTDVKRILNISDSTLARYRKSNKVPFTKIGNKILYPKSFFNQSLKKKLTNPHLM
jgi:hypothetical protein